MIVVSRQLGHANPNVTAQVYAHLLADSQLDAAAAAFAGLGVTQGAADEGVAAVVDGTGAPGPVRGI